MMPKRLSFQLYSARHFALTETLSRLAKIGYKEVEGYGGLYDDPKSLRSMLDARGLTMPTGHFDLGLIEKDPKRLLTIASTLGVRHVYAPYLTPDERPKTAAGWKKFAKRLAVIGRRVRGEGYGFGWHNHDWEFAKLTSGEFPIDILCDADPNLDLEVDIAWVAFGKTSPIPWIEKYGARVTSVHVKDIAPRGRNLDEDGWTDVGRGIMNWPAIFKALKKTRVLHYVVEHDLPKDVNRFAKNSYDYIGKF